MAGYDFHYFGNIGYWILIGAGHHPPTDSRQSLTNGLKQYLDKGIMVTRAATIDGVEAARTDVHAISS
jgi:hypothetical protein